MNLRKIYNSSPPFIQNIGRRVYPHFKKPIWKNPEFLKWYNFLQESQWWSRKKLEEYQMQQLEKLLKHAYKNIPYYRGVFNKRGLKPKDIQGLDDLKKLPFLTKEIIQNHQSDLIARNYPKSKLQYATTGGSTGIPMGFYIEKNISSAREKAFMLTQWNRVGYKFGDKSVILRGDVIQYASKGKFWKISPANGNLILSSYHMTDENLPKYIKKIREFKPNFIQAYPSAITILARFMEGNNIQHFPNIKAILCGSENLYPWQRELLEEIFQCQVYSWYGHSERAALAGECEVSTYYHIFPEYGIVELIHKNKEQEINKNNEVGEIVATGLNNFVFPFIRYRTMDLAVPETTKCKCGRNYPLLKRVEGRLQEFVVTKTGRLISMTAINMHSNVFNNLKQFQFYQDKRGEATFNIVKKESYTNCDTRYIRKELQKKLGKDMKLIINPVDYIPQTKSGKFRFLIQKLPIKFGD